ncbi:glycoside hydrolase domain-containing protein [Nocardia xishanensis]|uniref:Glycoside hydrolase domain-containing protein n=1 Tax=Nocardia xishanensis TaxID=238964 RepID=A0ABW7WZ33_9NOCA
MRFGLDYSGGRPGGAAIRAAGFDFVVRYLTPGGPSLPGKQLTPAEADDLRAHDISIVSNWETTAARMLDGYNAGIVDARAGLAQVLRCGGRRDRPIYFSADFDATPQDQVAIDAYLDGAASVLGVANVGIYGGYWTVSRALDAGSAAWAWQTDAWSGGNVETRRNIHQTLRQVRVNGVLCDVNVAETVDFGQWDFVQEEPDMTPEQDAVLRDIQTQLRGPGLAGWPQLGTDAEGRHLTMVDGLAAALSRIDEMQRRIDELEGDTEALRAQVGELRTEISELEATTADLVEEVQRLEGHRWPWPLSLIEGPAELIGAQLARLESLLPDLPGLPGHSDTEPAESAGKS